MTIFITIILILVSLGIIGSIVLQSGTSAGMSGSITGGAETFFGKKKGMDEFLSKITGILSVVFMVLVLLLVVLQ